jgi:hypothetical protein
MNRRGFLGAIFGGAAISAIDPERLLWQPGNRLISIPRPKPLLLHPGDVVTITGMYDVNPITKLRAVYIEPVTNRKYQFRKRFVITAECTADSMESWPPVITSGMHRNVDVVFRGGAIEPWPSRGAVERIG